MSRTITVQITQECIDEGIQGKPLDCPIALALLPYLNDRFYVRVHSNVIHILSKNFTKDCEYISCSAPTWVRHIIERFDNTGIMHPFELVMEVDEKVLRNV